MVRTPLLALTLAACATGPVQAQPRSAIDWDDADSGTLDGVDFRLADVDAPETGGVGSPNGAKCEEERVLGKAAKAFMVETTRGKHLIITGRDPAPDKWERQVLSLSIDGKDLGQLGIAAGHMKPYVFENGRAKTKKPKWCS